jgi:murein DD-endopeptidase MepM/ murein hydrolase activator NlpD
MSPFAVGPLAPEALLPATPRGVDEQRRLARKSPLEVAREFEAILVEQVIGAMRRTVSSTGLLGGASGADHILDGAFDHELARSLARDAHLGLAEKLATQIERHGRAGAPAAAPAAAEREMLPHVHASARVPAGAGAAADGDAVARLVAGSEGRVTSGFGVRRDPITGGRAFHGGIDVAAPRGSAVHAVAAGDVVYSGRRGRAGNVVEVREGDLVTTYAHVERALVRAGQKVAAGDVLATVGSTGRSTGPHVHVAVSRAGQVLDPAAVLGTADAPAHAAEDASGADEEA